MKVIFKINGALMFELQDIQTLLKGIPVKWEDWKTDGDVLPDDSKPKFWLIDDDQVKFGKEDVLKATQDQLKQIEKNYSESSSARWNAEDKLKKAQAEIEILRSACPKPIETRKVE